MSFTVLMEIWHNNKIMYVAFEMSGNVLPEQDRMEDRDTMVDLLDRIRPEYHYLDLVGVSQDDVTIWLDNLNRGEQ